MIATLVAFAVLLALVFLGAPLGFTMMLVGFAGFGLVRGWPASLEMTGQIVTNSAMSYEFSVIPLFLLMGNLIYRAELSTELYKTCFAWLGARRGGLAMATIAASGLFSSVCGTSVATAATMARVAMPEMRRYKYADSLASGSVAAGGTLGILIPPSVPLLLYEILTEKSIGKLFIAGIVPGVLGVIGYIIAIHIVVRRWPELGPPGPRLGWSERFRSLGQIWSVGLLFMVVLGGIYLGVFTPTEAGAIGAAGALAIAVGRRRLSFEHFLSALFDATRTTVMLLVVGFGALVFANLVEVSGAPREFVNWIEASHFSPMMVIITIVVFYILMGCVFEAISMILLTIPIFEPLVESLGFNPIWFGIVVVVSAEIGMLTPPIGLNVFVLKSVTEDISLGTIYRGVTPFWMVDILRLAIVVFVPALVLFLPQMMH